MKTTKRVLIAAVALAAVLVLLMLASVPWMRSVEDEKWARFVANNNCKPIDSVSAKCGDDVLTRP